MLRTNQYFLAYVEKLYEAQPRREDIVLKDFEQGQELLEQGEQAVKVFVIREGITKCFFNEADGKGFIVEFLGQGEVLGELEVVRHAPCLCTVTALTTVKAYAIAIPFFKSLLEKDLELNKLLLNAFAERLMNTASRASFQQLYTVEHTLGKLLELQAHHGLHISKEDMAAYLGVTIRSLNRTLNKLKQ